MKYQDRVRKDMKLSKYSVHGGNNPSPIVLPERHHPQSSTCKNEGKGSSHPSNDQQVTNHAQSMRCEKYINLDRKMHECQAEHEVA